PLRKARTFCTNALAVSADRPAFCMMVLMSSCTAALLEKEGTRRTCLRRQQRAGGRRGSAAERTERVKPHTPLDVLPDGVWRRCPVSLGATATADVATSFPAGYISRDGFGALLTSPGGPPVQKKIPARRFLVTARGRGPSARGGGRIVLA